MFKVWLRGARAGIAMCTVLFACGQAAPGSGFPDTTQSATGSGGNGSGPSTGGPGAGGAAGSFPVTSSGAAGRILPPTGTGGLGGSTGGPETPDSACLGIARTSTPVVVDIFIMLDKSGSMDCPASDDACQNPTGATPPTRWTAVTDAIRAFASAPGSDGVGVGIGFFPATSADAGARGGNTQCSAAAYASPVVPIAALPTNATPVLDAVAANAPNGGTPTTPALQGAIDYAKAYTAANPGRTAAVVFVTDGVPNGCNSSVATAASAATAGFTGVPPVTTYVVGLGATASLDQIALAGSGGATHYFPATGDVTGQLTQVLKQVSNQLTCDYVIPPPPMGINYNMVNVEIRVGTGAAATQIGNVTDASACGASGGWYYDKNPPDVPSKITICPSSCEPLRANVGSSVQVLFGCPKEPPR